MTLASSLASWTSLIPSWSWITSAAFLKAGGSQELGRQGQGGSTFFTNLPCEILEMILQHLPRESIGRLAATSTSVCTAVREAAAGNGVNMDTSSTLANVQLQLDAWQYTFIV